MNSGNEKMVENLHLVLGTLASLVLTIGITWVFWPAWTAASADEVEWDVEESKERTSAKSGDQPLLSIVIPAYNEEERIEIMLDAAHSFLQSSRGAALRSKLRECAALGKREKRIQPIIEWIVVNDGSRDTTSSVVRSYFKTTKTSIDPWRLLVLRKNCGKGAAVKTGMMNATGRFRLMVDADGATDFGPALEKLMEPLEIHLRANMDSDLVAVFGSRAHLQEAAAAQRSFTRSLLMYAFHFFVALLISSKINDTQCGFKLFTDTSSKLIFNSLHLHRWAFDTEIVFISDHKEVQLEEVGVPWHEVDGSKLNTSKFALAMVSISMLRDMLCVRICYELGIWKVKR